MELCNACACARGGFACINKPEWNVRNAYLVRSWILSSSPSAIWNLLTRIATCAHMNAYVCQCTVQTYQSAIQWGGPSSKQREKEKICVNDHMCGQSNKTDREGNCQFLAHWNVYAVMKHMSIACAFLRSVFGRQFVQGITNWFPLHSATERLWCAEYFKITFQIFRKHIFDIYE